VNVSTHLFDHAEPPPTVIERLGRVRRVPIFTTGNDFFKLYPPLRRPGRGSGSSPA